MSTKLSLLATSFWLPITTLQAATESSVQATLMWLAMTAAEALTFVHTHGVVLESGTGPVPSLASTVAGGPIRGSWWAHARSREIFALTRAVRDCPDVLVCRLIDGKITYVHRRLWSALVRVAERFPRDHLAQVSREAHGLGTTRQRGGRVSPLGVSGTRFRSPSTRRGECAWRTGNLVREVRFRCLTTRWSKTRDVSQTG